jgi:hypothetical protein
LAVVSEFDIPATAWRVHATASELCQFEGNEPANEHRACARQAILQVAGSFDPGEPLGEMILRAPAVQRVLGGTAPA